MAKRLSERQKEEIIKFFNDGKTLDELSKEFNCTKLTISRNLKNNLGKKRYKELIVNSRSKEPPFNEIKNENIRDEIYPITPLMEIPPLDLKIENTHQKDLSSIPISDASFPKIVYMIVDKKIELETKYLRDYPEWQFLSNEELERKTIQIYFDLKFAKRFCNNEQKVIKVPNTEVFRIVAPILLSRGISRIVSDDQLIAL